MAVIEYQSETGEKLWKAYASVKSKVNLSIRVQRWKFGCKTLKTAEREETALLKECQDEVRKRESQGSSWGAVVESWEAFMAKHHSDDLNEMTRKDYVATVRKYTETWWNRHAADINRADVLEVLNEMKVHSSSVSYQNKTKTVLNRMFLYGIDHRLIKGIDRSPTHGIQLARDEEKKPEILSNTEIKDLLNKSRSLIHPWFPVWAMALLTGMRNGELYALLWSDVDFENRQIQVSKSYNCRLRITKSTKAGYWRTVPMSDQTMMLLKEIQASAGNRKEVLPRLPRWANGEQARILREFCIGTGVTSIKFHTLRACFATQLIRNGIPPIQIQKICGWKDLETMQRYIRYAGIETDGATQSLKILPDTFILEKASTLFVDKEGGQPQIEPEAA